MQSKGKLTQMKVKDLRINTVNPKNNQRKFYHITLKCRKGTLFLNVPALYIPFQSCLCMYKWTEQRKGTSLLREMHKEKKGFKCIKTVCSLSTYNIAYIERQGLNFKLKAGREQASLPIHFLQQENCSGIYSIEH